MGLETIDATKPDGAVEFVSNLDNRQRETRVALLAFAAVEHHLTGEHKFLRGTTAARPAAGKSGRIYFNDDTKNIQYDNGSTWADLPFFTSARDHMGQYTGDGTSARVIDGGLNFTPEFLRVFPTNINGSMHIRVSVHTGSNSHRVIDGVLVTDGITALSAIGFSVGIGLNTNGANYVFQAQRFIYP